MVFIVKIVKKDVVFFFSTEIMDSFGSTPLANDRTCREKLFSAKQRLEKIMQTVNQDMRIQEKYKSRCIFKQGPENPQ